MSTEFISVLVISVLFVWLGFMCIFIGVCKVKRKSLKSQLIHEFILHQPTFGLVIGVCVTLISDKHGYESWICVMALTWYLIYALWALDSTDFKWPWLTKPLAVPLFCLAACTVFWTLGFRINTTPSLPQGIYAQESSYSQLNHHDLVGFCLAKDNPYSDLARERGYLGHGPCPNGLKPLMKQITGLPGDVIELRADGIILNGDLLPGTARIQNDSQGRSLPNSLLTDGSIPSGLALTLANHPDSFDSRHFGLVPLSALKKLKPVFTNNRERKEEK